MAKERIPFNGNVGNLPVRVLQYGIILKILSLHKDFFEELRIEIEYNGFQNTIVYDDRKRPANDLASINAYRQVRLSEPYLAFLWCLSYTSITLYQERKNEFDSNTIVIRAVNLLKYSISLFKEWQEWPLEWPNPEEFDLTVDPYIYQAKEIFLFSSAFIFCHEFGHHILGHTLGPSEENTDELREDEFNADLYALETMLKGLEECKEERANSARLGLLVGICSLLFSDPSWEGDGEHPDTDQRIDRVLEKLAPNAEDEIWHSATMIFTVWAIESGKPYNFDEPNQMAIPVTAKENYKRYVANLKACL